MSNLDEWYNELEEELKTSKAEQAATKAHDEYLERDFDKVAPVASKIHHEQMRSSRRKPTRFNADREYERILKVFLDIPEGFDVWLKKDDDLAVAEYRRKIQNIICQGSLIGVLYLMGRVAGTSKPDIATERIAMFLINHFLGNPPQRIAVADVSMDVQEHFKELAEAYRDKKEETEIEDKTDGQEGSEDNL